MSDVPFGQILKAHSFQKLKEIQFNCIFLYYVCQGLPPIRKLFKTLIYQHLYRFQISFTLGIYYIYTFFVIFLLQRNY